MATCELCEAYKAALAMYSALGDKAMVAQTESEWKTHKAYDH
jgi:hypothetical protein